VDDGNRAILERFLGTGPYFLGSEVSAVDFLAAKPLNNASDIGLLECFPSLSGLLDRIRSRPTYALAYESNGTAASASTTKTLSPTPPTVSESAEDLTETTTTTTTASTSSSDVPPRREQQRAAPSPSVDVPKRQHQRASFRKRAQRRLLRLATGVDTTTNNNSNNKKRCW